MFISRSDHTHHSLPLAIETAIPLTISSATLRQHSQRIRIREYVNQRRAAVKPGLSVSLPGQARPDESVRTGIQHKINK